MHEEIVDQGPVDSNDPLALHFWAEKFNVSPEYLQKAISQVGSSPESIARYIHDELSGRCEPTPGLSAEEAKF